MSGSIDLAIRASQIRQKLATEPPEAVIAKTKAILTEDDSE